MKLLALLLVCALCAGAHAAIEQPLCPRFQILNITSPLVGFLPNMIFYNGPLSPFNAKTAFIDGPWFSPTANCFWMTNGTFDCTMVMYGTPALVPRIGEMHLTSSFFFVVRNVFDYVGGDLHMTTTFDPGYNILDFFPSGPSPSSDELRNWKPQSDVVIHFRPTREFPDPSAFPYAQPIANALVESGGLLYLTLWGSSGYNATTDSFEKEDRGTGFDFRFAVNCTNATVCAPDCAGRVCGPDGCNGSCGSCPPGLVCTPFGLCAPPIIQPCPCFDPTAVFDVPIGCLESGGVAIQRAENSTCIVINFIPSSDPAAGSGCGLVPPGILPIPG